MAEINQRVDDIIKTVVKDTFGDVDIVSIDIEPDVGEDGEPILLVVVVFDNKSARIDTSRVSGLIRHIRPKMAEIGEDAFPVLSFIAKSELGKMKAGSARQKLN